MIPNLASYDAVVFDLDGTVWLSGDPMPGAVAFVRHCRSLGCRIGFATNISITTSEDARARLELVGLAEPSDHVMTAGVAVGSAIAAVGIREVAALSGPGLKVACRRHGVQVVELADVDDEAWLAEPSGRGIAVGGWPETTLREIELMGRLAAGGLPLFATSHDNGFPAHRGFEPGTGMMLAAARTLYDFTSTVCGKPSQGYADAVLAGFPESTRLLMVGDSYGADVALAALMGADSLFLTNGRPLPPDGAMTATFVSRDLEQLLADLSIEEAR